MKKIYFFGLMAIPLESECVIGNICTSLTIYFPTEPFTEDIIVTECILCLSRFLLYFLPLLKLFGTCWFSESNTVWHCSSLKCLFSFYYGFPLLRWPSVRTKLSVLREDQKAVHRFLLHRFHTIEEPKYQLEQEALPTQFFSVHERYTQSSMCPNNLQPARREQMDETNILSCKYVICSQEISKL